METLMFRKGGSYHGSNRLLNDLQPSSSRGISPPAPDSGCPGKTHTATRYKNMYFFYYKTNFNKWLYWAEWIRQLKRHIIQDLTELSTTPDTHHLAFNLQPFPRCQRRGCTTSTWPAPRITTMTMTIVRGSMESRQDITAHRQKDVIQFWSQTCGSQPRICSAQGLFTSIHSSLQVSPYNQVVHLFMVS